MMNYLKKYKESELYKKGIDFRYIFSRVLIFSILLFSYNYVSQFNSCTIDYINKEVRCLDILYREEGFSFNSFYYITTINGTERISDLEFERKIWEINNPKININLE